MVGHLPMQACIPPPHSSQRSHGIHSTCYPSLGNGSPLKALKFLPASCCSKPCYSDLPCHKCSWAGSRICHVDSWRQEYRHIVILVVFQSLWIEIMFTFFPYVCAWWRINGVHPGAQPDTRSFQPSPVHNLLMQARKPKTSRSLQMQ